MPSSLFKIDDISFVLMSPRPPGFHRGRSFESKIGVDGYSMWHGADRGRQFQVTTMADLVNLGEATAEWDKYNNLQKTGEPVDIVWADETFEYRVVVVNVSHRARRILRGYGGLQGASEAIIEAQWDLVIWEAPPPPEEEE